MLKKATFPLFSLYVLISVSKLNAFNVNFFETVIDSSKIEVIYDDEFVSRVLVADLYYKNIKSQFSNGKIHEKRVQNKYYKNVKDTLVVMILASDTVSFIKAIGNVLTHSASINSEGFILDKDIHVGVHKSVFRRKYGAKLNSDVLVIRDIESANEFRFYFKSDKLCSIKYKILYID